MGRMNNIPCDIVTAGKLHLHKLRWAGYDYTPDGTYWGWTRGTNIYWTHGATFTEQVDVFVRACSRDHAKIAVLNLIPTAKFYN